MTLFNADVVMNRHPICQTSCAFTVIRRAGRRITQLYDLVLAPIGLRATQFSIMAAIEQEGEIAQCRLAEEYGIAVETLSRRLGNLRTKGFVKVSEGPIHHQRIYELTSAGRAKLTEAIPFWCRAQKRLQAAIGDTDWRQIFGLLDRVSVGAQAAQLSRVRNFPSPANDPEKSILLEMPQGGFARKLQG